MEFVQNVYQFKNYYRTSHKIQSTYTFLIATYILVLYVFKADILVNLKDIT
jgi:hypothetical protein